MHDLNGAITAAKGSGDPAPALPGSTTCAAPHGELRTRPLGPRKLFLVSPPALAPRGCPGLARGDRWACPPHPPQPRGSGLRLLLAWA